MRARAAATQPHMSNLTNKEAQDPDVMKLWESESIPNVDPSTTKQSDIAITMDWENNSEETLTKDMEMVYGPVLERELSLPKSVPHKISDQIVSEMLPMTERLTSIKQEEPNLHSNQPLTEHPHVPMLLDWENPCYQMLSKELEAGHRNTMKELSPPKLFAQGHVPYEITAGMSSAPKQIKSSKEEEAHECAIPWLEKNRVYTDMLSEMKNMEKTLSSVHGEQDKITDRSKGLSNLLKTVIPVLECKLAEHFYRSNSSEVHLWVTIHAVAKRCNFEFSDFIKICCPSEISLLLKNLGPVDAQIHRLVDPDSESSLSYKVQAPATNPIILARQRPSYALSDMASSEPGSYVKCSNCKSFDISKTEVHNPIAPAIGLEHSVPPNPLQDVTTTEASFQAHSCSSLALSSFTVSPSHVNSTSKQFGLDNCKIHDGNIGIVGSCVSQLENVSDTYMTGCMSGFEPYPHLKEHPRAIRAPGKRRVQRQKRLPINYDQIIPKLVSAEQCSTMQGLWSSNTNICAPDLSKENCDNNAKQKNQETDLQFLLQKELKPSDVGNLGRIVLPKRQAEKNLPHLETKEGVTLPFEDLQTSQIWNLRFRFWPNNKTRMYLLECTGQFVKFHRLQEGDIITLYKSPSTGKYMINGKKVASMTSSAAKSLKRKEQEASCLSSNSGCSLQLALAAGNVWPNFDTTNTMNEKDILINANENRGDVLQCTTTPSAIRTTESAFMNDLNETEGLIQELSRFEADSRPIDEIIVFNKM